MHSAVHLYWAGQLSRYSDSLRAGRSGDRIAVGARFSTHVQTSPGAHPNSYTMGTGSFLGIKRPDSRVDHPPPPRAGVKETVELCIYSPPACSGVYSVYLGGKLRGRDLVATKRPSIPESSVCCHRHETLTNSQLSYFFMQQTVIASHRTNYDFSHIWT